MKPIRSQIGKSTGTEFLNHSLAADALPPGNPGDPTPGEPHSPPEYPAPIEIPHPTEIPSPVPGNEPAEIPGPSSDPAPEIPAPQERLKFPSITTVFLRETRARQQTHIRVVGRTRPC